MNFTADWFSNNIPVWNNALAPLKNRDGLCFLEIGSFEGRATCWMLENILTGPDSRIHCADPFPGPLLQRFRDNIAPWSERVIVHQGRSEDMLPNIAGPFDVVYIDGLHLAFNVLQDAALTWNKLKVGGIMIFDDYLWGHQQVERSIVPKDGVDAFLSVIHGRYDLIHFGYQVIIRKNENSSRYEQEYFKVCQKASKDLNPIF